MNRSFTVKYEDSESGVVHLDDGKTFKLIDKEKKINSKPLVIFMYDIITMINAMMNIILWHTINTYLFEDSPFQNYVINNAIVFATKALVVGFGFFGVYYVFRKDSSWVIQLYSAVRLMETFMIGSLKFVYMIGLFRFVLKSKFLINYAVEIFVFSIFICNK